MRPPVLVTAPTGTLVEPEDLARRLRLADADGNVDAEDLGELVAMIEEVVAHLDGWSGVLRRAILPQTWRIEVEGAGPFILPLPDVIEVTVTAAGEQVPVADVTVTSTDAGPSVAVAGNHEVTSIEFRCALPDHRVPAAAALVKLMAGHRYANREAVVVGAATAVLPLGVPDMIQALRWDGGFAVVS